MPDEKSKPPRAHVFTGSSSIASAWWNEDSEQLAITFRSGRSYVYEGVPLSVWEGFTSAQSPGQYFHSNIRDVYS